MTLDTNPKLLVGALAFVLVAGMASPAFAGGQISVCHVPPDPNTIVTPATQGALNGHLGHGDIIIDDSNTPAPDTISSEECVGSDIDPEPTECTLDPEEVSLQLGSGEFSDPIAKTITCSDAVIDFDFDDNCQLNDITIDNEDGINVLTFDEYIENLGDTTEEHCTVTFEIEIDADVDTIF